MEMAETMEAAPFWAEIVKQLNSLENLLATKPLQGTCCHMCGCVHFTDVPENIASWPLHTKYIQI